MPGRGGLIGDGLLLSRAYGSSSICKSLGLVPFPFDPRSLAINTGDRAPTDNDSRCRPALHVPLEPCEGTCDWQIHPVVSNRQDCSEFEVIVGVDLVIESLYGRAVRGYVIGHVNAGVRGIHFVALQMKKCLCCQPLCHRGGMRLFG